MGVRVQAQSLSLASLKTLEKGFDAGFLPHVLQVCLGAFLWLTYFRARFGDGCKVVGVEFLSHSVVMTVSSTKTQGSGKSRLPLELVSPKQLVSGIGFFKSYIAFRELLQIPLGPLGIP